jgi:hypothetical protein
VLETGEVLFSDASQHKRPHPAQPDTSPPPEHAVLFPTSPPTQKGPTAQKGLHP